MSGLFCVCVCAVAGVLCMLECRALTAVILSTGVYNHYSTSIACTILHILGHFAFARPVA